MTKYTKKAIQCGSMIEVYEYSAPIFRGLQSRLAGTGGRVRTPKPRTSQSTMRTRKKIRQLVNSNPTMNKFLTLTFAENVTDIATANYEFKKFRQKLQRHLGRDFKYLGVIEFQKRGAVHYHLMLDIPFIDWKTLSNLWGQGRIQIEKIKKPNRAGLYMAKTTGYLVKGAEDTRLYGKRVFFYAINMLDKAIEMVNTLGVGFIEFAAMVDRCKTEIYRKVFYIEGHGLMYYTLYDTA